MPQQELPRKLMRMLKESGTVEELADLIIKVAKELPKVSTPLSLQVFQASNLRKPTKKLLTTRNMMIAEKEMLRARLTLLECDAITYNYSYTKHL